MKFGDESSLFGNEKDDSFKGSIGAIYQSYGGEDLYPALEEKAANLLYFVTKNHSFSDGNKRIAAAMFLYFLDRNGALFEDGQKLIDDHTLVALTIMIAESNPKEKRNDDKCSYELYELEYRCKKEFGYDKGNVCLPRQYMPFANGGICV